MSTGIKYPFCKPEVWGGIECTINRVKDSYRDQLCDLDHYGRPDDIEMIAALGISRIRYPVLWEKHHHAVDTTIDWSWTATQLDKIRSHGIDIIAGLLHHGSGPVFTRLDDPEFPEKLAAYAGQVAERFPWLTYYTPVNEPLTTARFSGLYGFWYPHAKSERTFFDMLLNQLRGTVLAIEAIRRVNPAAQLIQTEDLAKTYSTPRLRYQAEFENHRRWLTYDLLCGRVDPHHFFWSYLVRLGIREDTLRFFQQHPCPPSIIGYNYYVTSERFLDDDLSKYPAWQYGGNGRHTYVDTEAVRTPHYCGVAALLKEAWQRYHLPMAITECHLNCTREEQVRWFKETWDNCCQLNHEGVDIRAITAWALLGAFDWNSLLTERNNHYESGAFAVHDQSLRPTAISKVIHSLATTGDYSSPLLQTKGWWNGHQKKAFEVTRSPMRVSEQSILIVGGSGTLGNAFQKICQQRAISYHAPGRNEMNLVDTKTIAAAIEKYKPWAIINAAGYVRVDEAEIQPAECFAMNTQGPAALAGLCAEKNIHFMTFSSDLVFDGVKLASYHEEDAVKPLNVYGVSKAEAERMILAANPDTLIIRSSSFFGPWDQYNFAAAVLDTLKQSQPFSTPADVFVSPTYVPDLVNAAMDLFIDEEKGIWHLTNEGATSWADFALTIADRAGLEKKLIVKKSLCEMGWKAMRPTYSVLHSERGIKLPTLDKALERYFAEKVY